MQDETKVGILVNRCNKNITMEYFFYFQNKILEL